MDLEIKQIYSTDISDSPPDLHNFSVRLYVEIGEKNKAGAETFHFTVTSPSGLQTEMISGHGFRHLRGYILMEKFAWQVVHRAIENLLDQARSRKTWDETISYLNRYGIYDSEDLNI